MIKVKCVTCGIKTDIHKTSPAKNGRRCKKCVKKITARVLEILKRRKTWTINPVTRIIPNKKKKTRAQRKQEERRDETRS